MDYNFTPSTPGWLGGASTILFFPFAREPTAGAPIAGDEWFCDGFCDVAETLHEACVAFLRRDVWTQ